MKSRNWPHVFAAIVIVGTLGLLAGCSGGNRKARSTAGDNSGTSNPTVTLALVTGSENESLFGELDAKGKARKDLNGNLVHSEVVRKFEETNRIGLSIQTMGSVDIMHQIESGTQCAYDAVCPANDIWISLGNEHSGLVKNIKSIQSSPVVYAVERSVAQSLGWLGADRKSVAMDASKWRAAAESGMLNFAMTSATRSNSGAMAYLGFLQEYAGHPEVLTAAIVQNGDVTEKVRQLLKSAHRSSGSSGWLKDLYLDDLAQGSHPFNAMINYESIIIELNQKLARLNHEPFIVFYPVDALALANSPLGYVDKGDAAKSAAFQKLQDYLLSPEVQAQIEQQGRRRADQTGLKVLHPDPAVWNADWGIDPSRILSPFTLPDAAVLRLALEQYQTSLRKPSLTVYVLDYSGSMGTNGGYEQLKQGMELLLNTDMARQNMLMPGAKDIKIVIPFNGDVINKGEIEQWTLRGNDPTALAALLRRIRALEPNGGTNMYAGVAAAFDEIGRVGKNLSGYHSEIIVMSDGRSSDARDWMMQQPGVQQLGSDIPVFTITFGDADPTQMEALATQFHGRKFDGSKNLVLSLQEAQGYNQ